MNRAFALLLLVATPAFAQVPPLMNNQGMLRTAGGGAVTDGSYDLTFALYPGQGAKTPSWTETVKGVTVQGGFYSTVLGGVTPFPAKLFEDHGELWLGVAVGAGAELPRARLLTIAYAFESDHALLATAAEGLQCTGCVDKPALGFDLDAAVTAGAKLACYDTAAELRTALDAVYAPLSHKHAGTDVTSPVAEALLAADSQALAGKSLAQVIQAAIDAVLAQVAAAGYLKKTDKLDQAQLPPNGLDEVSNGLLTNQFQVTSASPEVPVNIHDFYPPGVATTLEFPDVGTAEKLTVTVSLTNSNISGVTLQLKDPAGASYTLYDKGRTGGTLTATWPDPTATVSGDLTTWVGKNPKGTWTLTTIDMHFDNKTWPVADGQVTVFSIATKTLSPKKVEVNGDAVFRGTAVIEGAFASSLIAGEPINTIDSIPQAVYVSPTDGMVHLARCKSSDGWPMLAFGGFALAGQNVDAGQKVLVQTVGIVRGFAGLIPGHLVYLSGAPGEVSGSPGIVPKVVGMALSTTELQVLVVPDRVLSVLGTVSDGTEHSASSTEYQKFYEIPFQPIGAVRHVSSWSIEAENGNGYGGYCKLTMQLASGPEVSLGEVEVGSYSYRVYSLGATFLVPPGETATLRAYGRCVSMYSCSLHTRNLQMSYSESWINNDLRSNSGW